MLMRKKYFLVILVVLFVVPVLALLDLDRQHDLAEKFARAQLQKIVSGKSSLADLGMPDDLLDGDFHRVDTDYTFTQWVVVFDFDGGGYVQVYVKPKRILLLPILNFEDDFEIDYVNYESN